MRRYWVGWWVTALSLGGAGLAAALVARPVVVLQLLPLFGVLGLLVALLFDSPTPPVEVECGVRVA